MQIVTGRRGEPHVTSRQMQAVYRSFLGDFALLDVGAHLAATATSNDNVRISDGVVAVQGIYAVIAYNEYDDNYIEPVSVGMKRIDTLILHYTKSNDVEDMQIEVVEGEEVVDNPVAPTIAEGGDAWEGTADIKVPIYDVLVTSFGLTVTPYSRMNTLIPTLDSIAERIPETVVTGVKGDSESLYRNGNVNITKANIGLGNVDNTADTDKPISTATQTALNLKADLIYVNAVVASAYHAGGNLTVAELTSSLLIADNMGKVYNMSDSGVTTADFVEGAGKPIREGDDIGICNRGTVDNPIYKFNLLSGFVDLSAYATTSAVNAGLAEKVDKVAGKGLSTNDYTDAEKQKLANIEYNAQANVQSDWNEDDTEDDGYIKNKPDLSTSLTATGNPITIEASESNLVECVAEVEAVQDLHGYDHPWIGGAGKNKLQNTLNSSQGVTVNDDGSVVLNGTFASTVWPRIITNLTLKAGTYTLSGTPQGAPEGCYIYDDNTFGGWTDGGSGSTKTFENDTTGSIMIRVPNGTYNNVKFYPMIEVGSQKTTFAPYSNICPISGWDEVNVGVSGVNVWDEEWEKGALSNLTGEPYPTSERVRSKNFIPTKPTTAYYFYAPNTYSSIRVACYDKDKNYLGQSKGWLNVSNNTSFMTPDNTYYIKFIVVKADETYDDDISINYPSTDTEYHAYAGKTYTIQLKDEQGNPIVCYGGSLDVVNGELTVDRAMVDLGSMYWNYSASDLQFYNTALANAKAVPNVSDVMNGLCDHYKTVAYRYINATSEEDGIIGMFTSGTTNYLAVKDTRYTSSSDFTNAVSGTKLIYELAEPYTIQLTPQQIRLLKGTNNLSCNTGDLSIEYYPDNVLGQLKGDIEKGLNAYYDYQIQALWDKINELQA